MWTDHIISKALETAVKGYTSIFYLYLNIKKIIVFKKDSHWNLTSSSDNKQTKYTTFGVI